MTATLALLLVTQNTLTEDEKAVGWKLLFDGKSTAGWRGYKKDAMPPGWQVVDGVLVRASGGAGGRVAAGTGVGSGATTSSAAGRGARTGAATARPSAKRRRPS